MFFKKNKNKFKLEIILYGLNRILAELDNIDESNFKAVADYVRNSAIHMRNIIEEKDS